NLGGVVEFGSPRDIYFTGTAYGQGPFSVQWFHNEEAIPGATNRDLYLGPMTTNESGQYFLIASNSFGAVSSAAASLIVLIDKPFITSQPMGQTIVAGSPYEGYIAVGATGALPLDFHWFHNGQPIAGTPVNAFNNLVYFGPVSASDAGDYFVIVSNFVGVVTSAVARITVSPGIPPTIEVQPQDQTIIRRYETNAFFYVYASGTEPLS